MLLLLVGTCTIKEWDWSNGTAEASCQEKGIPFFLTTLGLRKDLESRRGLAARVKKSVNNSWEVDSSGLPGLPGEKTHLAPE